jgi:hypothetical protein
MTIPLLKVISNRHQLKKGINGPEPPVVRGDSRDTGRIVDECRRYAHFEYLFAVEFRILSSDYSMGCYTSMPALLPRYPSPKTQFARAKK